MITKREGNDGYWSTFALQIGTPPQTIRVLPSSSGSAVWAVLIEGCIPTDAPFCSDDRGGLFDNSSSTTWQYIGLFELPSDSEGVFGYTGNNAFFGTDDVTLGYPGGGGLSLTEQIVAGFAAKDFYLGTLGLTPRPINVTGFTAQDRHPSLLGTLVNKSMVPSASWSYGAGAKYQAGGVYGSLTFGGYDSARQTGNNLTVPLSQSLSRDIIVGLQSITSGDSTLLSDGILIYIDSTISEIWLPVSACLAFEKAFNLTYNETAQFYYVDDALHSRLVDENPSVIFHLGATASGGTTINITLPYAAFDLELSSPLFGGSTSATQRYFPLQRAANESQNVLGRTFLQEAYLTVDYDRSNFTLHQAAAILPGAASNIVPILSPALVNATSTSHSHHESLSNGAIAGVVVGVVIIVLLATILVILYIWYRRKAAAAAKDKEKTEATKSDIDPNQVVPPNGGGYTDIKPELDAQETVSPNELEGKDRKLYEMPSPPPMPSELSTPPPDSALMMGRNIHEMQGSDAIHELQGDSPRPMMKHFPKRSPELPAEMGAGTFNTISSPTNTPHSPRSPRSGVSSPSPDQNDRDPMSSPEPLPSPEMRLGAEQMVRPRDVPSPEPLPGPEAGAGTLVSAASPAQSPEATPLLTQEKENDPSEGVK